MKSPLRLGIDTGGTYTDAVLVDDSNCIVAAAKRLTTHHELTTGIGEVLDALPAERLLGGAVHHAVHQCRGRGPGRAGGGAAARLQPTAG